MRRSVLWLKTPSPDADKQAGPPGAGIILMIDTSRLDATTTDGLAYARVVLVLVDEEERALARAHLTAAGYEVTCTWDGHDALDAVRTADTELIILDSRLANPNAYQLCERLRSHASTSALPVVLAVSGGDAAAMARGASVGVDDFLRLPATAEELLARTRNLVESKRLRDQRTASEHLIFELARLLEEKLPSQSDDPRRLAELAVALAKAAGAAEEDQMILRKCAFLHDIGKVAVREAVLLKHDRLSDDEFNEIKLHPEVGELLCGPLADADDLLPVIRHQRERWDGAGYPDQLAGERIPLLARIFAIADAYVALTRPRPYRDAFSAAEAEQMIQDAAGAQFDPGLVELFRSRVLAAEPGK